MAAPVVTTEWALKGTGTKSVFKAEAIGEDRGDTVKNPVTGEDHFAHFDLPDGFIWRKGECRRGTFRAIAGGPEIGTEKSNWILYAFDWSDG